LSYSIVVNLALVLFNPVLICITCSVTTAGS